MNFFRWFKAAWFFLSTEQEFRQEMQDELNLANKRISELERVVNIQVKWMVNHTKEK